MCPICDTLWPKQEGGYNVFFNALMMGSRRKAHPDVKLCRDILAVQWREATGKLATLKSENQWFRDLFEPKEKPQ
jgi:hypothetical protein